ncbi:BTAD domain-containing putative transcriptional regulator [Kutzneria sp. NPDC052558]|uniref:AfsR/SARP family transcriptional regulator n=1 Tax=Kutzneria sp. NPDC052558 TaxID=3364121 RepID=UPI0037CB40AF
MDVRVLGTVEVTLAGTAVNLGGPKPTTLLALLAIHAGAVVTTDQIIDVLWLDRPPANVRATIHTHVSALRRILGPDVVARKANGYLLRTEHATVDLCQAWELATAGRGLTGQDQHEEAVTVLRRALALWRGDTTLGGATGEWVETERARIAEFRLGLQEDLLEAALATGRQGMPIDELTALVEQNPLRERLRGHLIRTLAMFGRQAEALSCYQAGSQVLAAELGVQPGAELQAIHRQLLAGAPAPDPVVAPIVPRQLPAGIADFTGRVEELRRLAGSRAPIVALAGKPGAGKSTLAIHIGQMMRERFTDGELYVDLRGGDRTPLLPIDVLGRFLRALGVDESAIPGPLDERAALYRSLLADRAVLVLLDNAVDEAQVRPLLPSGANCRCLTTSRARLSALAGADHVNVPTLTEPDALDLFARIVGNQRVAQQPEQAREIVRLCGRLPLAVRVAGARLAARPDWPLARLVDRLGEQRRILNKLSVGDLEVRGSLNLSYHALPERERLALRRLGWLGTPDFSVWLLAVLIGATLTDAENIAEHLVDAQLADTASEDSAGVVRYRLHDLTRVFAWERAEDEEAQADLVAVVERVAECSMGLVNHASDGTPMRLLGSVLPTEFRCDVTEFVTDLAPLAWFDAEQAALVHIVERTSQLELAGVAARLATALCSSSFAISNRFTHWWRTHTAALEAARRAGDVLSQGLLLVGLGWLRSEQDRLDEAIDYYQQALTAFDEIRDERGSVATHLMLASAQRELGQLTAALRTIEQAWPALMAATEPEAPVRAHHIRGTILTELGQFPEALRLCERAVAGYQEIGDAHGVGLALRSMGIVHRAAGRLDQAATCCERALALLRPVGDHLMTAYAVQALAKVRIRQGNGREVRESLAQALRTCHDMQDGFGQALVLRTLGELELAVGRPAAAVDQLENSMQWWPALSLPLWHARCQRDLARALRALDRHAEADRVHAEAMAVFLRCESREAREENAGQTPTVATWRG